MGPRYLAACAAAVTLLAVPTAASATPAGATLSGQGGASSFDPTLACAAGGDGPSWRAGWNDQPAASPGGVLGGEWDGSFEVHDAGTGGAFVPDGTGRLAITVARGGSAFLETRGGGSCDDATLALSGVEDGEPVVSGSLPVVATGGVGVLTGLTGSGSAAFTLGLGPGADNTAQLALSGDFDVPDPALRTVGAGARWANLSGFLGGRLPVTVTLANAPTAGHAFAVRVTGVTGGTGVFAGVPSGTKPLSPGAASGFGITMLGARPGHVYTLGVTVRAQDALLAEQPPVTGTVTFQAPLLP